MSIIKPAALRPGNTIGIVAPASNIKRTFWMKVAANSNVLASRTHYRPDIATSYRYLSGTRTRRLEEFWRC